MVRAATQSQTTARVDVTRVDAHCHTNASSGPAVSALGLIGCPECYSEPEQVYDQARQRGMDLVAITDHDTIRGALSLAERGFQGVVIGEEVTVSFPEDRCKLHVLVWCLTPELHDQLEPLRRDVYAFARWLREHNLPHSLAHPLYIQNHRLTRWHLDRCALLFKGLEVLNGAHSGTHVGALETYLKSLTPGRVHRLIEEHALEPLWPRIWDKARTGGSDDHGLLNVGRAWTQVEGRVTDGREFFRAVMNARCEPGGAAGHSSLLAHQLTTVAANYTGRAIASKGSPRARHIASKLLRLAGVQIAAPSKARLALNALAGKLTRRRQPLNPLVQALRENFGPLLEKYPDISARLNNDPVDGSALSDHDRMAALADDLYAAMHKTLSGGAGAAFRSRDARRIADQVLSYAVLELSQLPYLFSLFHQNKERRFVQQLEQETAEPGAGPLDRPLRVLLFTDTLGDVNGVSRFIRNAAQQARETGRDFTVVTSTNFEIPREPNLVNIAPVFATKMPRYEHLELVLPPLVKMLRFADRYQPDVVHISTPGSVGFVGAIAARMLRVPMVGVYHTDFPAYIDHLFEDDSLTYITQRVMSTFYSPFRAVFTRSADYVPSLEKLGVDRERIIPLKPGIMTEQFHPRFRDDGLWERLGAPADTIRVLNVGRVSVEKNLPLLTKVWKRADSALRSAGMNAELVIVGDGPYREQMQRELAGTRTRFLGFRYGEELSSIYATSDLFVFPSTTDTLGQVVMESQASGLPVIVTDQGGPKEVVREGETGFVIPAEDVAGWADRIVALCSNDQARAAMGQRAHESMQPYSMRHSFEHYWQVHEQVRRNWLERKAQPNRAAHTAIHAGAQA
jgi:glycosyltransferase involved in cell wall biosynthesis